MGDSDDRASPSRLRVLVVAGPTVCHTPPPAACVLDIRLSVKNSDYKGNRGEAFGRERCMLSVTLLHVHSAGLSWPWNECGIQGSMLLLAIRKDCLDALQV